jgi:hypothetical protein
MTEPGKNERNAVTYNRLARIYDRAARNPLFECPRTRLFELAAIEPADRVLTVVEDPQQTLAEAGRRPSGTATLAESHR